MLLPYTESLPHWSSELMTLMKRSFYKDRSKAVNSSGSCFRYFCGVLLITRKLKNSFLSTFWLCREALFFTLPIPNMRFLSIFTTCIVQVSLNTYHFQLIVFVTCAQMFSEHQELQLSQCTDEYLKIRYVVVCVMFHS